ncbi:MAG: FAD-binding oxidoreductase [Burkholderiales bacterium]|nr:FAD-binding oxidoreductase [Burkholderiales bacterium]
MDSLATRIPAAAPIPEPALAAMRAIVGEAHVSVSAADLDLAGKATIPDAKRPAAIVAPASAQEVAAVLRICAQHGLHVWPVSTGRNWGYGSATAVREGAVLLRLSRMNRILEVNERLAYAVVEPGVTYRQLRAHLDARHPSLWCDSTDGPPEGSVLGNALDRGLGVTHYGDHFGTLCGMEVVLANGEIMRTGGGPEGCKTWHTHKWGVGPYVEGLFSQSNLGVVTKAGVWLLPKPEAFASFTFDLAREDDLPKIVDIIRELALREIVTSAVHLVNDICALSVLAQYPAHLLADHSRLPADALAEMRRKYLVAPWSFGGGIQGTAAQVRIIKKELRARLAPLGRLMFVDDSTMRLASIVHSAARRGPLAKPLEWAVRTFTGKSLEMLEAGPHIHDVLKGIPSDYFVRHAYFKSEKPKPDRADPDRDDIGGIWFAPIAPMSGEHISEVLSICKPLFERFEFDFYAALLVQNARSMIILTSIFYRKDDARQTENARALYHALGEATSRAGYQTYRMGVGSMARLAKNAPEFVDFTRTLKRAADPDAVLAPGKYGA